MATKRTKKVVLTGITTEEMESAFADYATADARLQKLNALMDEQFTRIRDKYAGEIATLSDKKDKNFAVVQAFALENREEIFTKKKSLDTVHGTYGFRTGTPKLKTLRGFTWASSLNLIKAFLPNYVRTKEEPAKEKLIADRELPEVAVNFEKCGIEVVQDETFFIELKKEEQE
ncbi:MAG: host-nuclease inhibitor Gam family protein [Kiritimatiellales bacterium]